MQIKIIVYFRRQDQFLQAVYNEVVKHSNNACRLTFWKYIEPILEVGGADPRVALEPFIDHFGAENIIVRAYEKGQFFNSNLIDDFLQIFDIEKTHQFEDIHDNPNPRIHPRSLEFIRIANSLDIPRRHEFNKFIDRHFSPQTENPAFSAHNLISAREQQDLLDRFHESNAFIARNFLGRQDGKLFYEEIPPDESHCSFENTITAEEMVGALASLWKEFKTN